MAAMSARGLEARAMGAVGSNQTVQGAIIQVMAEIAAEQQRLANRDMNMLMQLNRVHGAAQRVGVMAQPSLVPASQGW
jgi:hypothetical protein